MNLCPADFVINTYNTSNSGWVTDSIGVEITHVPTNFTVRCDTERSVWTNRTIAWEMMLKRLNVDTDLTKQLELF